MCKVLLNNIVTWFVAPCNDSLALESLTPSLLDNLGPFQIIYILIRIVLDITESAGVSLYLVTTSCARKELLHLRKPTFRLNSVRSKL